MADFWGGENALGGGGGGISQVFPPPVRIPGRILLSYKLQGEINIENTVIS